MWRWLLFGAVALYAMCAVGLFVRNIGDKHFHHYEHYYRLAAYDALQWPLRLPALSREVWQAAAKAWEES